MKRRLANLLVALALVSAAASLLPLAATLWWVADLFSHFRWQFLASQIALAPLLLAAGRKLWLTVLAPPAALNLWVLLPYFLGPGAAAAGPANFKVVTVNVRAGNDRFAGLLTTLEQNSPDAVLIVEYTEKWREHLAPLFAAYRYHVSLPREDPFGIALLSRYPIEHARERRLESTPAIDARVIGPAGPIRIIGVHLVPPISALRSAERNRQLGQLARLRGTISTPLIITGDFNISPFSPYFQHWLARTGLMDSLRGRGPSVTWPSYFPLLGVAIDQCVVSREFSVAVRKQLPGFGSDHYPVLVELTQDRQR